jgi:RNA polymerase sigma factor (sigma-70 family)
MKKQSISDEQLVKNYISGNDACMEMLIKRYKSKVYTAIYLVVQDSYMAEDIFQETFIRVIRTLKSGKYQENGKFLPWIMRISRNLAIDYYRKIRKMPLVVNSDGEDILTNLRFHEPNSEDLYLNNERDHVMRRLIKELPDDQKEVLILRHYGDLSFKEIADLTQVSINTALGRMRYALINLKKLIDVKAPFLNK